MNIKKIIAVFKKELKSELKTRYAVSAILLFIFTTIIMITFATAGIKLETETASGVLWIIMFFSAMTGLAKSFISEEERGTGLLLQISTDSASVFFGKLLFNILLALVLNAFGVALFFLFNDYLSIHFFGEFLFSMFLASVGLAGATTIISALIAKGNSKNALFPVLAFPILVPLILLGIESFRYTMDGGASGGEGNFRLMLAYSGLIVSVSYLLFDFVWKE